MLDALTFHRFARRLHHFARLQVIHRHRFFAKHVPAGAERSDGLRSVQENGRGYVNGVDRGVAQSVFQRRPHALSEFPAL